MVKVYEALDGHSTNEEYAKNELLVDGGLMTRRNGKWYFKAECLGTHIRWLDEEWVDFIITWEPSDDDDKVFDL